MSMILDFLQHPKGRTLTLLLGGAAINLSFSPFTMSYMALMMFILLYYTCNQATTWKESFKYGFIFGYGYFISGLYWICIGLTVYIADFWWAIPLTLLIFPAFLSLYIGCVGAVVWHERDSVFLPFIFATIWTFFEYARSNILTGFAWNLLGYSFGISDNFLQIANLFGPYFLSMIAALCSAVPYYLLIKNYKLFAIHLLICSSVLGGIFLYGDNRLSQHETQYTNIGARVVQPSIKQTAKWSDENFWDNIQAHTELSVFANSSIHPDIIIWPESAVTYSANIDSVQSAIEFIAQRANAIIITGGLLDEVVRNAEVPYNLYVSMYALSGITDSFIFKYNKIHLLPFAEYVPYSNILPLKKITHGMIPYTPGDPSNTVVSIPNLFSNHADLKIRPLICYEATFPNEVRISNQDADVIINITNDAWYGDSIGPYQHFFSSRMRAIENGLPLLRSANNGISAVIDPLGRIIIQSKINDVIALDSLIPYKLSESTFYSKYGDFWLIICCILCLPSFPWIMSRITRNKKSVE